MTQEALKQLANEMIDTLPFNTPEYWICRIKEALAQPEQEPDYWLGYGLQAHTERPFEGATPLYTAPLQRKPLTDGELADLWYKKSLDWLEFGRAIEAAHGINAQDPMPLFDDWNKDWK